jgi:hypothetical protein
MKSTVVPASVVSVGLAAAAAACLASACSTSSAGTDAGIPVAMCAHPGAVTPGPADDHCATGAPDGGPLVEAVTLGCKLDAAPPGDDGGLVCPYGTTTYGMEADDDDCKYHVAWTSTPICETPGASYFTLHATYKSNGMPLAGAAPTVEAFVTSPPDCGAGLPVCDTCTQRTASYSVVKMVEGSPGTYVAPLAFNQAGIWTVRFHFFDTCDDTPNTLHGHVAFHVTVP